MKKDLVELVFILDRSGSMTGLERDTIGGFNSMIDKQKKIEGEALVSTVLFDDRFEVLHNRVNIKEIKLMTSKDYYVRGSTALLDAIGRSINHMVNVYKKLRSEDKPEKTVFVITTDGMENASREYSIKDVNRLINVQKEKYGWEFIFLGANIDAVSTARAFGIHEDRVANYHSDQAGTELNYQVISETIENLRIHKKIEDDWKNKIDKDYQKRK